MRIKLAWEMFRMYVCVCVRERERERDRVLLRSGVHINGNRSVGVGISAPDVTCSPCRWTAPIGSL